MALAIFSATVGRARAPGAGAAPAGATEARAEAAPKAQCAPVAATAPAGARDAGNGNRRALAQHQVVDKWTRIRAVASLPRSSLRRDLV